MSKPRITKDVEGKRLIEFEAVSNINKYYFIRLDGSNFSEFRVNRNSIKNMHMFDEVMLQLSIEIRKRFGFIKACFYYDDKINLFFNGNDLPRKRRIIKNLTMVSSFTSVVFNKILKQSNYSRQLRLDYEYIFDSRIIELEGDMGIKDYVLERLDSNRHQLKNMIENVLKVKDTNRRLNQLISKYLITKSIFMDYRFLFGTYIDSEMKVIKSSKTHSKFVKYIYNDIILILNKNLTQ
ncbi:MAG: tRNAHis guanylyltransferase [Candidatus Izimaplasma bacterium HR2]|nr:MAG: tRNAHis guanylyltransferase [Candidatus Izimaplasma bacterium HR2]